jgi:hypothetical protein
VSKLQVLALIFAFWCPAPLFADQIVLKNGDRLSGSIEKSDDKVLVIKTEFAGHGAVACGPGDQLHAASVRQPERR